MDMPIVPLVEVTGGVVRYEIVVAVSMKSPARRPVGIVGVVPAVQMDRGRMINRRPVTPAIAASIPPAITATVVVMSAVSIGSTGLCRRSPQSHDQYCQD